MLADRRDELVAFVVGVRVAEVSTELESVPWSHQCLNLDALYARIGITDHGSPLFGGEIDVATGTLNIFVVENVAGRVKPERHGGTKIGLKAGFVRGHCFWLKSSGVNEDRLQVQPARLVAAADLADAMLELAPARSTRCGYAAWLSKDGARRTIAKTLSQAFAVPCGTILKPQHV